MAVPSVHGMSKELGPPSEGRYAQIPMNDDGRQWIIEDANDSPLYVRIWTQEPQDFDGVTFEIADRVLEPHIPQAEYERLMERRVGVAKERQDALMARCHEHPERDECYFTAENQRRWVNANRPPPPARDEKRPASPGADYVWIGGAWQWNGADYVWISGMWRYVPPAIVATAAGSTQTTTVAMPSTAAPVRTPAATAAPASTQRAPAVPAPTAKAPTVAARTDVPLVHPAPAAVLPNAAPPVPATRAEALTPAPRAGAMWIAGYWTWSGRAWVWTPGHWQMPPERNMRWTPPALQINPRGIRLFMPGGWIRIGR